MSSDCERTRRIVSAFLGKAPADVTYAPEDLESAFRHVQRCAPCTRTFSPEERSLIIHGIVMDRE